MVRSAGWRFITVGFLTLLMFIPLFFAAEVINARKHYSQSAIDSVSREWGGAQALSGPQLVIPVETTVTRISTRPKTDPLTGIVVTDARTGEDVQERFEETVTERGDPVFLYPERFEADVITETQERRRGIFRVPVYTARLEAGFDFAPEAAEVLMRPEDRLLWEEAELRVTVSGNRGLRGTARLTADGRALGLEPQPERAGLVAALGDPRAVERFALTLGLNGAQSLMLAPVGRESEITLRSDWPHPSFTGAFLPDRSEITDEGFEANWTIPHLARSLPQVSRTDPEASARRNTLFGVHYATPNDFYQKAYRAARYGILFIALTFLTILLMERGTGRPAHAVQYILAGLAQTTFVLLMVSYAEHIGFAAAYALSSGATVGLLTLFGFVGLKLGARAWLLGAVLVMVYAVLYLILRSADYALLAGSTLAFLALALTMVATRNEDWHGPDRGPGLIARAFRGKADPDPDPGAKQPTS